MGYTGMGQNNPLHMQDLWLGVGMVGELRLTAELKSQNVGDDLG